MFLYYQHRRALAADLAHENLGWGLRQYAADRLQPHRFHQRALVLLSHLPHQVAATGIQLLDNPALLL